MGCCESKESLSYVNRTSNLHKALLMKTTKHGQVIQAETTNRIMTEAVREAILRDPKTGDDIKTVLSLPLCKFDELKKNFFYLTSMGGMTRENLTKFGITLIINATFEMPLIRTDTITSFRVPVDDDQDEDISIYFDEVAEKIKQCKQLGGKCVVHCMAGASRSTTLALAYIIKNEKMNLKNAFTSVRKRRECARPNISFWEQLIEYEKRCKQGKASVRILHTKYKGIDVKIPDLYNEAVNADFRLHVMEKQWEKYNEERTGRTMRPDYTI